MRKEIEAWNKMERDMQRQGVGAMLFFVACLALVWLVYGCQPAERPSTVELLVEAEAVVTAAIDTVGEAVQLGTLDPASDDYATAYRALHRASELLDIAWDAYRAGDMAGADRQRRAALALYQSVRPLLQRIDR